MQGSTARVVGGDKLRVHQMSTDLIKFDMNTFGPDHMEPTRVISMGDPAIFSLKYKSSCCEGQLLPYTSNALVQCRYFCGTDGQPQKFSGDMSRAVRYPSCNHKLLTADFAAIVTDLYEADVLDATLAGGILANWVLDTYDQVIRAAGWDKRGM